MENEIFLSLTIKDIQEISQKTISRELTEEELEKIREKIAENGVLLELENTISEFIKEIKD